MDFVVRPITPDEIDRVPLRCWPDHDAMAKLFASQETIGMAAWDGNPCVAQLHCYRSLSVGQRATAVQSLSA
jgi:hypothetical protein